MWKVVVIVCALGNPCVVFEQEPMVHYHTKSECMANASVKHGLMVETYGEYGYIVEKSDFTCEKVPGLTNS